MDTLEISINAISDTRIPQIVKVPGRMGTLQISILVDSSSTHNFLNDKIARKLGITPTDEGCFEVVVANREKLSSVGHSKMGMHRNIKGSNYC